MPISVGTVVTHAGNTYKIIEVMDRGGFAIVYRAIRTAPDQAEVVVKVPGPALLAMPDMIRRFKREARILANISHRNVVRIVAFWEFPDGELALVQELVREAQKLPRYLAAHPEEAASLLIQALYAFKAVHGTSTETAAVHRDVSPNNLLVDADGVLKVIDFGLAREAPRQTDVLTRNITFGTEGCIAPEQLRDAANADHRADLYGLGRSFAAAIQARDPVHVEIAELDEPWKSICARLAAHDAGRRYASAEVAIGDALSRFADANIILSHFPIHVSEMEQAAVAGWPEACDSYFSSLPELTFRDLELASQLHSGVFTASHFDSNSFFSRLEESPAIQHFSGFEASFDDADALGALYSKLYPSLSPELRKDCFRRLCRVAVRFHRYYVMGVVRGVYASELDVGVKEALVDILVEEDPNRDIYSFGVLPTRD